MVKGDKWMSYSKREVETHAAEIKVVNLHQTGVSEGDNRENERRINIKGYNDLKFSRIVERNQSLHAKIPINPKQYK